MIVIARGDEPQKRGIRLDEGHLHARLRDDAHGRAGDDEALHVEPCQQAKSAFQLGEAGVGQGVSARVLGVAEAAAEVAALGDVEVGRRDLRHVRAEVLLAVLEGAAASEMVDELPTGLRHVFRGDVARGEFVTKGEPLGREADEPSRDVVSHHGHGPETEGLGMRREPHRSSSPFVTLTLP